MHDSALICEGISCCLDMALGTPFGSEDYPRCPPIGQQARTTVPEEGLSSRAHGRNMYSASLLCVRS